MNLETFSDRQGASDAAASLLAAALRKDLASQLQSTLVVSGGSTPQACFDTLAAIDLPWDRIEVTLTDERCVAEDHPDSNQRMVSRHLLKGRAAHATFVDIRRANPRTFGAVLLGMGADGHFASLFPDAPALADALAITNPEPTVNIETAASPHARVSMTLRRLLDAKEILLLAFGDDKHAVLEQPKGYPIHALLSQAQKPVRLLWAP